MRLLRSMVAVVIVAVVLSMNARASHAYQTGRTLTRLSNRGDSQWCLVTKKGADSMQWECEYDTSNDCATAVAGTGGYCAINPFWQSDKSSHGRFLAFSRTGARQPNCWTSLDESR